MSETNTPLRQRMIEDMAARKLNPHTQRSHIQSCKRFAAAALRELNPTYVGSRAAMTTALTSRSVYPR